jgi:hypothetical protein
MVHLEEDCHTGYIVDHSVIFSPFLGSGSHNCVTCVLWAIFQVEGPNDLGDLLVG